MSTGIHVRFYQLCNFLKTDIANIPVFANIVAVPHLLYTLLTTKTDMITIHEKYCYTENGFTKFMVIDKNHHHYCVNNSLWYWKWDSIEDWNILQVGNKYHINYYGIRFPLISFFPNIYRLTLSNVK